MFINSFSSVYAIILIAIFWIIGFFSANSQSKLAGLPRVTTFRTVDAAAGMHNWSLTQDSRGLLYVANNAGLLEFDGVTWRIHPVSNGTKVRSVAIDGKGRIYVGCQGDFGYFFPDARGELRYTSLADSLQPKFRNFDETWNVFVHGEDVYFCTFSRIYFYHAGQFSIIDTGAMLELSFFVDNELYVSVRNQGLAKVSSGQIRPIPGGEKFESASVSSVIPLGKALLISTFQHGVFVLRDGLVSPWKPELQEFLKKANVNCLVRLKSGALAAGTQNEGLVILDDQGRVRMSLTRGKGLENRTVLGIYEDPREHLWVAQVNGIAHIELGSPLTFINEQNGLPGTGYTAYLDGEILYLGTNTGLYTRNINSTNSEFKLLTNTGGQVYNVGDYDDVLMVNQHTGALQLSDKDIARVSAEQGSWKFLLLRSKPGKMIEGTYGGLQLYERTKNGWKFVRKLSGFSESSRVIAEDVDGAIWVTHAYKGAYRITLDQTGDAIVSVKHYGKEKGFPSDLLINVYRVGDGLVFTTESGLYTYDRREDSFVPHVPTGIKETPLDYFNGAEQIWSLQEDAIGNLYFAGRESIGILQKTEKGYFLNKHLFENVRALLNDDLLNIHILENNEVVFGAKEGFIHYDPSRQFPVDANFRALIRSVSCAREDSSLFGGNFFRGDSVSQDQRGGIVRLPFENNSLRFSYASSGFTGSQRRSYQVMLEQYDKSWSDWTSRTQKEYTNLREGTYIFRVRARNDNSVISEEARYVFAIAAPWYRSKTAFAVYVGVALVVLLLSFGALDRKYRREQKLLEKKRQLELEEKENEIEEISLRSSEQIARLQNEKLQADLVHMNSELATATMHILNKNEFITGVKNQLHQIIRRNEMEQTQKDLQQITRDIERNISSDADWEQFQFHFDRVHGDFTNRFKATYPALTPQEMKLSAYLRMNLSTKEVAQLLHISVRGVEISRYRLRKKLNLDRGQNLQEFIMTF